MTFGQAIQSGFRKYALFEGRATRSEFWWFALFYLLVSLAVGVIDGVARTPLLGVLVALGFFLPLLALEVRRLHDTGRSGWWIFISLLPIVGTILIIVWWCQDSEAGQNRFGPDPRATPAVPTFAGMSPPRL